ncbi:hypothetical protein J0S82_002819, partial [Galemys pyrenaicus]
MSCSELRFQWLGWQEELATSVYLGTQSDIRVLSSGPEDSGVIRLMGLPKPEVNSTVTAHSLVNMASSAADGLIHEIDAVGKCFKEANNLCQPSHDLLHK